MTRTPDTPGITGEIGRALDDLAQALPGLALAEHCVRLADIQEMLQRVLDEARAG